MSQCVPSWDLDDNSNTNPDPNPSLSHNPSRHKFALRAPSTSINSSTIDVPTLDYEVAELTWKNGQLAMHGLGPPRVTTKPQSTTSVPAKYTWDKPRAGETLEAIVNQATLLPYRKTQVVATGDELVPWQDHHSAAVPPISVSASATMTMDALVPSSHNRADELRSGKSACGGVGGCSTHVGSCSADPSVFDDRRMASVGGGSGGNEAAAVAAHEWSSCRDQSVSGSATFGMDSSRQLTVDTCERDLGVRGFTSPSTGSPENTISGKHCTKSTSPDEHDSVSHSRTQREASDVEDKKKAKGKSSISTKRSRAAAVHNQSERKRRDKINQRMKTLQKLVPNSSKTDKASMLDEVIEYLKQLQAQVQMMSRMNMTPMMMPLAMQQQLQMSMMNTMGMGMGMGMGVMDLNSINRSNITGISPGFHPPSPFMPMTSWDGHLSDRVPNPSSLVADPMSVFLACQPQPSTMDAYNRMATLNFFQQMQNQPSGPVSRTNQ